MKITILNIAYHRNGIAGLPFQAVVFRVGDEYHVKLAIVFERSGHTAVLDIAKLIDRDIELGSNSWRGDRYERRLRKAISKHQAQKRSS